MKTTDLVAGSTLLTLAISVHLMARQIEPRISMGVDSGFFPEIASSILAALALVMIVQSIRGRRQISAASASGGAPAPRARRNLLRVAATCAAIVLYGLLVPHLGFPIATAVYLPVQFVLLSPKEERKLLLFFSVAIVTTGVIYGVFSYGFGLILPSGIF